jgi:hypothetical protein
MGGAAATFVLLLLTGASTATWIAVSATAAFAVVSVILFRVLKLPESGGKLP